MKKLLVLFSLLVLILPLSSFKGKDVLKLASLNKHNTQLSYAADVRKVAINIKRNFDDPIIGIFTSGTRDFRFNGPFSLSGGAVTGLTFFRLGAWVSAYFSNW